MTTQSDTPVLKATGQTPLLPEGARVWVLTDGKAGDAVQCIGVAEALGGAFDIRQVAPRRLFTLLGARGPLDPREAPGQPGSPIAPPFPDVLIASGRRTLPYLRAVKAQSQGRCFTAFLKDPRRGPGAADFIWAPEHDRITGPNVLKTLTSPHRLSADKLAAARAAPPEWLTGVASPRVAVLVGGNSRHHRFRPQEIAAFAGRLEALAATGAGLMGSRSRRTPPALTEAVGAVFARHGGWWWDGEGDNPYLALLAHADALVVTADSVNMIGEAAATGRPILVFEPHGGHAKIGRFLDGLAAIKLVHRFEGALAGAPYAPLDSTPLIASALAGAYRQHVAALARRAF